MKKLLIGTASVLAITLVSILNVASNTGANFDELGVQQELTNHGERLDNHEDRITNVEKDVMEVQDKTGVAPSTERVIVREVVTQPAEKKAVTQTVSEPEPEPEPEPKVVITSYKTVEVDDLGSKDCLHTYSDGTTYQRKFTRVTYDNSFKMTKTSGVCDETLLNLEKTDEYPGYKY